MRRHRGDRRRLIVVDQSGLVEEVVERCVAGRVGEHCEHFVVDLLVAEQLEPLTEGLDRRVELGVASGPTARRSSSCSVTAATTSSSRSGAGRVRDVRLGVRGSASGDLHEREGRVRVAELLADHIGEARGHDLLQQRAATSSRRSAVAGAVNSNATDACSPSPALTCSATTPAGGGGSTKSTDSTRPVEGSVPRYRRAVRSPRRDRSRR